MKSVKLLLLTTVATAFTTYGQINPDYDKIVSILVAGCPEIKQLVASNKAEIESQKAENTLENPTVDVEHVWGKDDTGKKLGIGISQEFEWPGVYRARAKAINAGTRASELMEQSMIADKMLEVEQLVIDIVYQRKTVEVAQQILDHMKDLEKGNIQGYKLGELTKLDIKKIEIERISASSDLRDARRVLDELYAQLESLTGNHECRTLVNDIKEIPEEQILAEADYEKLIDTYDPQLAWLRAQSEAATLNGKAEVMAARAPSFSLGYVFEKEQGEVFNGLGASMTLPIYSRKHIANSARANVLSIEIEAEATHLSTVTSMRALRTSVLSIKQELDDYTSVFGDDNYAQLLSTAVRGGQLDNLRYLEELNFFLEAARERLELEHEYKTSLASLNRYNTISRR